MYWSVGMNEKKRIFSEQSALRNVLVLCVNLPCVTNDPFMNIHFIA